MCVQSLGVWDYCLLYIGKVLTNHPSHVTHLFPPLTYCPWAFCLQKVSNPCTLTSLIWRFPSPSLDAALLTSVPLDSSLSFWAKLKKQYSWGTVAFQMVMYLREGTTVPGTNLNSTPMLLQLVGSSSCTVVTAMEYIFFKNKAASSVKRALCLFILMFAKDFCLDNLINNFKKTSEVYKIRLLACPSFLPFSYVRRQAPIWGLWGW